MFGSIWIYTVLICHKTYQNKQPTVWVQVVSMTYLHFQACDWWDSVANEYYRPPETQPGVRNVDFILYVAAVHSEKCAWQKTVAFAAHCQLEKALDR